MKNVKIIILMLLLSLSFAQAKGCWDLREKSNLEFDELNDVITFSIKDAMNCKAVANAKVKFGSVSLTTDSQGFFRVPLDVLEDDQKIIMTIQKADYIKLTKKLVVEVGSIRGNKVLLSPRLAPQSVRFVLSWSNKPKDMDIHLSSDDFHISHRDTRSITGKAKLDRDAMSGFGPETITLTEVNEHKTYALYVDRYSKSGQIDSTVEVQVYIDNRLAKLIKLPKTSERAVKVMTLRDGQATYMNTPVKKVP